jgi:hypothetical protein
MTNSIENATDDQVLILRATRCCGGLIACARLSGVRRVEPSELEKEIHEDAENLGEKIELVTRQEMRKHAFCPHLCRDTVPDWAKLRSGYSSRTTINKSRSSDQISRQLKALGVFPDGWMPSVVDIEKLSDEVSKSLGIDMMEAMPGETAIYVARDTDQIVFIAIPEEHPSFFKYAHGEAKGCHVHALAPALGQAIFDIANNVPPEEASSLGKLPLAFGLDAAITLVTHASEARILPHRIPDIAVRTCYTLYAAFALWYMGMPRQVIPYLTGMFVLENPEGEGVLDRMATTMTDVFFYNDLLENVVSATGGGLLWEHAATPELRAQAVGRSVEGFINALNMNRPVLVQPHEHPGPMVGAPDKFQS